MGRFVEGADREQASFLPACLADYVDDDNVVRAIDAFVDALDLTPSASAPCRRRPDGQATIRQRCCGSTSTAIVRRDGAGVVGLPATPKLADL